VVDGPLPWFQGTFEGHESCCFVGHKGVPFANACNDDVWLSWWTSNSLPDLTIDHKCKRQRKNLTIWKATLVALNRS
jgi:hypothetical protein